jgi:hypothetical protein
MSNNLRQQFPGIAKADTLLNTIIQLGTAFIILTILYVGCQGYFALMLPSRLVNQKRMHKPLAALLLIGLIGLVIVAGWNYGQISTHKLSYTNQQWQSLSDMYFWMASAVLIVPLVGYIALGIAALLGRDVDVMWGS